MSRSMARPAMRPSKPGARGALTRCSTWSTTCTAAVRPKRATSAAGSASLFSVVPVAVASVRTPVEAFDSVRFRVSPPSSCESSSTVTSIVADLLPEPIVRVPLADR